MDIISGWCASNYILIDPDCMFVNRLVVGSTTHERLSGTIKVRRAMINAEQAFKECLWTKQERRKPLALGPLEVWQGGGCNQPSAASKICPAI